MKVFSQIVNKLGLNKGHARSIKAKKNIVSSIGIKGGNILIGLIYVPVLLDYLGQEEYGVWLTISSVVAWFSFFDIGLGNGLRNNFATAIANGNHLLARKYVSTSYAILSIIAFFLIIIFSAIAGFVNWNTVFNTQHVDQHSLFIVVLIVFNSFFVRFVLQLIGIILLADQRPALNNSLGLISNFISLLLILLLKVITVGSLVHFSIALSFSPLLVFLFASLLLYKSTYKAYKPSIEYVDFSYSKDLLGLGLKFFIIQITDIIIYTSTNFLISNFSDPGQVVVYNVAYKLFAVSTMAFTIVLTPLWSAITEAYALDDMEWIKRTVNKIQKFGLILCVFVILVLLFSDQIYRLWLGDRVAIPFTISFLIAITSILRLLLSVYVAFQNGVGKIKLVLYLSIFQSIFYVPLAYFLGKVLALGIVGIILAGLLIEIPMRIQQIMQYYKIINKKATGLWLK